MSVIDPARQPLLLQVAKGSQWIGTDQYPSCDEWADEHEAWLRFLDAEGALKHYLPRVQGPKEKRDEALAEIAVAYFFVSRCGFAIAGWEPPGEGGRVGEFLLSAGVPPHVFVEVKAPGWEQEIAEHEGQGSPRLGQPKYVQGEARATAPWASVRHAVKKAYPKMPDTVPTLLVINDDLFVPLANWRNNVEIALNCPSAPGHTDGYLAENGSFVDARHERLGAVGVFHVDLVGQGIRYRFEVFENAHTRAANALPAWVPRRYP